MVCPSRGRHAMSWVGATADAGGLDNVLASHTLNPEALRAHLALYRTVMFGDSPLGRAGRAEAVASGETDTLDRRMAALCSYARKLTRAPAAVSEADVAALRRAGLDDRAIVDANQVVAYFNYVNRVVEGLGVELEERWPAAVRTRRRYAGDLNAGLPTLDPAALPWLSVDQMREVDRLMVEE